jgi:hypothetical protein
VELDPSQQVVAIILKVVARCGNTMLVTCEPLSTNPIDPAKCSQHQPLTNQKNSQTNNDCWKAMAKDGFYDKATKQFPNDGGRLCALMEISPSRAVAMDIKRRVQKLLTLKTSHYVFGEIWVLFCFFFPICNSLTVVGFRNLAKFRPKKKR